MAHRLSAVEGTAVVDLLEQCEEKPDISDLESFQVWMKQFLTKKGKIPEAKKEQPKVPIPQPSTTINQLMHDPRISVFSGDSGKDVSYDIWRYEVRSLVRDGSHSEAVISRAIRKSVRGEPARVVMQLGERAEVFDILGKLDSLYGTVESSELLLANFYSSTQGEKESVASWACRLEDMLVKATKRDGRGGVDQNMLRTKLWSGLRPGLKDATRHKFDSVREYTEFVIEVRSIEAESVFSVASEQSDVKRKEQVKMAQTSSKSDLDELKGIVKQLSGTVEELQKTSISKSQVHQLSDNSEVGQRGRSSNYRGRGRGQSRGRSHTFGQSYNQNDSHGQGYGRGQSYGRGHGRGQGYGRGQGHDQSQSYGHSSYGQGQTCQDQDFGAEQGQGQFKSADGQNLKKSVDSVEESGNRDPIVCWKCGQIGHVQSGCRAHLNRDRFV